LARFNYIDVVQLAQRGDLNAYNDLVVHFQDMAYGYAYAQMGDVHVAQDVTQEAFIEGFQTLHQLRHPEAWPVWLQRLVFKQCDRVWRRKRLTTTEISSAGDIVTADLTPEEHLLDQESKHQVLLALQALPEPEQTVITLFYMGDYSQKDIATFLDVSTDTVKNRLRSGRQKLKQGILNMAKQALQEDAPSKDDQLARVVYLVNACKAGEADAVKQLLSDYPDLINNTTRHLKMNTNAFNRASYHPLHYAAREGRTEVVKVLLEAGMTLQAEERRIQNAFGTTTLEIAQIRGFDDIVKLLTDAMPKPEQDTVDDEDPIRQALKMPDRVVPNTEHLKRIFELVKEDPKRVYATDIHGNTPLHRAAEADVPHYELINFLLDQGADIEATNLSGQKPIHLTIWKIGIVRGVGKQRLDTTRYFLHKGAQLTIHIACALGDVGCVEAFLNEDAKLANALDSGQISPLSYATAYNRTEIVKRLLEAGADPNLEERPQFKTFPLYIAARNNQLDIARLLLEAGANPNAWVDSSGNAMGNALDGGFDDMADLIASYGGTAWAGYYAYHLNFPVVAEILKLDSSQANQCIATLNEALPEEKNLALVRMAFKFGAKAENVGAWTLFRARNWPTVLRELFENGVHPDILGREGLTRLHGIAKAGFGTGNHQVHNFDAIQVMLEYGADLHARDDVHCATPIAWAAMNGHKDVVQWFLEQGAKPNLPDDEPWSTPLFWAEHKGYDTIVSLLKEHGAT